MSEKNTVTVKVEDLKRGMVMPINNRPAQITTVVKNERPRDGRTDLWYDVMFRWDDLGGAGSDRWLGGPYGILPIPAGATIYVWQEVKNGARADGDWTARG
jgi:hypothetical protein